MVGSERLAAQVALCLGKALHLLAEKAEYMAATGALPRAANFAPLLSRPRCAGSSTLHGLPSLTCALLPSWPR